jgi:hypothetical protein
MKLLLVLPLDNQLSESGYNSALKVLERNKERREIFDLHYLVCLPRPDRGRERDRERER